MAEAEIKTPKPYARPLAEILADLAKPIAAQHLASKKLKGQEITFLPWYRAIKYLDYFAPGWSYRIASVTPVAQSVVIVAEISIPAAEGVFTRQATGIEDDEVSGWGDPTSNAESMALRRAAAKFGLGLYLYEKK